MASQRVAIGAQFARSKHKILQCDFLCQNIVRVRIMVWHVRVMIR